jgi:tetratricopeptide (TPR) repeat protein
LRREPQTDELAEQPYQKDIRAETLAMLKAERDFHRKSAAAAFNKTWDYLEQKHRSSEDDAEMLQLAHASRYHWGLVGTPLNQAVGDWQISRVYASLGQADLALRYAERCLSACRKKGLGEIVPSAYEAVARAYAVAKDSKRANEYLAKAKVLLDRIPLDKEDRGIYLQQIEDTQRMIDRL